MDLDKVKDFSKRLEMFSFSRIILLYGTRIVEPVTNEVEVLAYKHLLCVVCI